MVINVKHIIVGLNVGGAELMLKRLIETSQFNAQYRHSVVSLTTLGKIGQQLKEQGVDVQALGMRSVLDLPRVLWCLVRLIRAEKADIVQTWMYHADLLGGLAARLAGNQHVIWGIRTTDINTVGSRATALVRRLCAWLSATLPHTIVCAAEASRKSHIAAGYAPPRFEVVPNGFDLARLTASIAQRNTLRIQCGFDDGLVVVGSVGRFHTDKDQANFVSAAGMLTTQFPHVRFLMVGRDIDGNNAKLKEWISATGCAERFVLLGERADIPVCLSAMDLFCLSSRTEGFPNAVGEAMAMGLPCVSTDVGDAALLVADTGVVVPKEDSRALAAGVGQLLAMSADARQQLGQKAQNRIHAEFSMERCRERFEKIYYRLTQKGSC